MKKKVVSVMLAGIMAMTMLSACGSKSSAAGSEANTEAKTTTEESAETAAASAASGTDGVTDTEVNIAMQPSGAFIPFMIAREEGWLEESLSEYGVTVNWNDFESGPPMNESMAAGSSDIGFLGDVPAVSAIAAGQDNVAIAIAAEGTNAYALLVPADSDVKSVADLKGQTVSTVIGSTGHNLMEKLLSDAGLDINTDVNFVNINAGDAGTVLSTGQAAAVTIWEPNVTRLIENGTAKPLAYARDTDLLGVNPIMANREFAESNPVIINAIVDAYKRGVEELPNLSGDTLKAIAEYLSLDEAQVATVAGNWDYTVDITDKDIAGLNDTIDFLVKIGNLTDSYDFSEHVYGK